MTLYRAIGRLVSPFRVVGFNIYNFLFRTPPARIIVRNEYEELLLVKSWGAQRYWSLPGGGVKYGEQPIDAARRELREETGLDIPSAKFTHVATLRYRYEAPIFTVAIKKAEVSEELFSPREIIDVGWFSLDKLPQDLSPIVSLALKNLSKTE